LKTSEKSEKSLHRLLMAKTTKPKLLFQKINSKQILAKNVTISKFQRKKTLKSTAKPLQTFDF